MRSRLALLGAAALLLSGCAASGAPAEAPAAPAEPGPDTAAEAAAMDCVTGAWVAETAALQQLFDETAPGQQLTVDGSIVYEFLEHGFGLTVIPTAFTMTMGTPVGDMVGEVSGRASGIWTVRGDEIHVAGMPGRTSWPPAGPSRASRSRSTPARSRRWTASSTSTTSAAPATSSCCSRRGRRR